MTTMCQGMLLVNKVSPFTEFIRVYLFWELRILIISSLEFVIPKEFVNFEAHLICVLQLIPDKFLVVCLHAFGSKEFQISY